MTDPSQTYNQITNSSWYKKFGQIGGANSIANQVQSYFQPLQNLYNQQQEANTGYSAIMNQAQNAYGKDAIANYYNIAQGNLNRNMGNAASQASRTAGAHSTNMLNPSGFILNSLNQAQAPYAAQSQQLQATGAQAQQSGAEGLTNLMYLLQRAKQGDAQAANQLQYQYAALQQQQRQYEDSQSGFGEKLLGGLLGFAGSATGTKLLFPG
jgi:hypothetical protein